MGAFFSMGGYAGFIWPCYLLTLGGIPMIPTTAFFLALTPWSIFTAHSLKMPKLRFKSTCAMDP